MSLLHLADLTNEELAELNGRLETEPAGAIIR